jgi:transcriptional regulator with XRE-family HTH domain
MRVEQKRPGRPRLNEPPSFDKAVGERIRKKRELCNMTPIKLADRSGQSVYQISRFESGDQPVKPEVMARIAEALGCKASDFLDGIKAKRRSDDGR